MLATALAFTVIPVAAGGLHKIAAPISVSAIEAKIVKVQDAAKVDALLAKAVAGGRITAAQSTDIKAYWTANHTAALQISVADIEAKIVKVQDGAKVDALLAKAVSAGRITAADSAAIKAYWTANHAAAKVVSIANIEAKIVGITDGARIDAALAKAVAAGRITAADSAAIKAYWTANHK
jgi:uncharacterized ParB-like nuclease family protein